MKKFYSICVLAATLSVTPVFAQSMHTEAHQTASKTAATVEYEQAMDQMHGPMMEGIMDQDADVAFVKGMIPHHQGAIEMAKTVLKYGKDPEIRKLAENVIRDQDKEIEMMQAWLAKHQK